MINFSISKRARQKLRNLKDKGGFFRIRVDTGGCFGFQYAFSFDAPKEDDHHIEQNGVSILIDKVSASFLDNSELDYQQEMIGSQFVIHNPSAQQSCGCKNSFSL